MSTLHDMPCPVCQLPVGEIGADLKCGRCGADLRPIIRLREMGGVYLNQAIGLADSGKNSMALEKLMTAIQHSGDSASLRILAGRILRAMGRQTEALEQWRRASELDPNDPVPGELTAEMKRDVLARRRRRLAVWTSASVVLVTLIGSLSLSTLRYRSDAGRNAAQLAGARTTISEMESHAQVSADLDRLAELLRGQEGLYVEQGRDTLRVVFAGGLFPGASDKLPESSSARLVDVAKVLASQKQPYLATVTGFTDNLPLKAKTRWKDSRDLELARAWAAADCMKGAAGTRIEWAEQHSSGAGCPSPNDTYYGRISNRTVVITVSPNP